MDIGNEKIYERVCESFYKQGFLKHIGAKVEYASEGVVVVSCEKTESLLQQMGVVHAGVISTIADTAGGYAALTVLPEGKEVVSVELKVNLMRPGAANKLIARGEVLKAGKSIVTVEATVVGDDDKLIAKMIATMFVVDKQR